MAMTDDELLARILEEPDILRLADTLGLEPEDYAKRVLFYMRNPNAEPQLTVLTPEAAKEAGVPSVEECLAFGKKLESGEISFEPDHMNSQFAGFEDKEKSITNLTGAKLKKDTAAPPLPGEKSK
jgi:hypothetical protein